MRLFTAILVMLFVPLSMGVYAQESVKPHIAVYVTGDSAPREIRDALGAYMLDALANSGFYRPIERAENFLSAIDEEHMRQRSGAIDDDQIRALGKQSGVQFICAANITITLGESQVAARIIDVETAEVVASGVSSGPLKTLDDLKQISANAVFKMLGVRVKVDQNFELLSQSEQTALEQSIARMIEQTVQQSQKKKLPFWIGYGISAVGAGIITYGVIENGNMDSHKQKHNYTQADNAKQRRNIAYGVGIPILLGGISIIIIF